MANKGHENLKPFVKGDPRINRKGRPKTFDAFRSLAQQVAHEVAKVKENGEEVELVIDGHTVTVAEAIIRSWSNSADPKLQIAFVEYAFGKVPNKDDLQVSGPDGGELPVLVIAPGLLEQLRQ